LDPIGWWNEYVEAVVRYGAHEVGGGKYTKGFGKGAMADYMAHYFHTRFEDYYSRVKCPLLLLSGEEEVENERERAVMEGLIALAAQGEVVVVSEWQHPYGWLLSPEGVSGAILNFLGRI
jgi:2-succinyl-6-hydroxy-2,4-cyclohexadiene-1-carboxylate synthase